ncbi:MAG: peptidylprolyl isomerase [Odoribacter sp.]|nr:peptidylprolyl isomerase [Odoribacter sp.]
MRRLALLLTTCLFPLVLIAQEKEVIAVIETNMGNMKVKLYNDTPIHRDNFVKFAKAGKYDGTLFYRVIKNFVIQGGSTDSKNARPGQFIGFGEPAIIEAEIKPIHYHKKGALAAPRQPDRIDVLKESDISQFYIVHGRKYPEEELDKLVNSVNVPIRNSIQRKHYTPEKKAILDSLREQKKVKEFREIADKIKDDIAWEWNMNTDKIEMPEGKKEAYVNLGGVHHLDSEYTVFGEVIEGLEVIDKIASLPTDKNDRPTTDVKIKVRIIE